MKAMTVGETARTLGVHPNTVSKWIRDNDREWEKLRDLRGASTLSIEMHALAQINKTYIMAEEQGRSLTAAEVDMIAKQRKLIETMNRDMAAASNGIEAVARFVEHLQRTNPVGADAVREDAYEFCNALARSVHK